MPREKLWPPDSDDRSFHEQMTDLGVEVVKSDTSVNVVAWYNARQAKNNKRLGHKISIAKTCIYLGDKISGEISATKILFGVGELKTCKVLLFKPSANGYLITPNGKCGKKVGTKMLTSWLHAQGLQYGRYEVRKTRDGFVGIPVENKA